LNGVKIPQKIESYTVEMDDEKILEALQKPQTEEEWMKNLPFDLKKVMAGNKKEIEKYLQYIEKYPDRVVELGVPLDVMGTSRGDGFGIFKFQNSWLGRLFGRRNSDEEGSKSTYSQKYRWVFWASLIGIALFRFFMHMSKDEPRQSPPMASSGKVSEVDKNMMKPVVAYQSGVTDIDMKIDSMYGRQRKNLMDEHLNASFKKNMPNEKSYEEYLKNGGRPVDKIENDISKLNNKTIASTDSLKRVYRKKIVKYLAQSEEKYKKKITDSLKNTSSGKPADQGIVKTVLKKKQKLVEDSLGRLYGTKDIVEPAIVQNKPPQVAISSENEKPYSKYNISFSEIVWLIIFMTGVVGLYNFIVRKRTLNIGGDHVPSGIKIFLVIVLVGMLAYIFYPLIEMFGYNWFVWILIIGVVLLLYRLFSEDKTILNSDKDE
jgi:hypothetical protein